MFQISVTPVYGQEIGEDGPYTVVRYRAEASTACGRIYHHFKLYVDADAAWQLADKISRHVESNRDWQPEAPHWFFDRFTYGSKAYQANQGDCEHYAQRLDVEAEYGAGSYGHRHPGYLKNAH